MPAACAPPGGTSAASYTAGTPSTGRPAAVQVPSPAAGETKGVRAVGEGSGGGAFGASEVDVVVGAAVVVVVDRCDVVVVLERVADVGGSEPRFGVPPQAARVTARQSTEPPARA